MASSLQLSVAVGLATAACLDSEAYFDDNIPLPIEHVAAATGGERGAIRRVSPLRPVGDSPPILRESGEFAWYLGWDQSLEEMGFDLDALRNEPLIPAPDCRPGLPEPQWTYEVSDDQGVSPIPAERRPRLSHRSITSVCPTTGIIRPESEKPSDLIANTSILNECRAELCEGGLEILDDCRLNVDLGRCVGQAQVGFVDRAGGLCVEPHLGCRNTDPGEGALMSVICDIGPQECRFHFYQPDRALEIEIETLRLTPPLSDSDAVSLTNRVSQFALHEGHIPDLAVGRERVVAVTRTELVDSPDCSDELNRSRLVTVGGSPLTVLSEARPELPCLDLITLDEDDELYGVYGVHPELYFVRFDASGAVRETRLIPSSVPSDAAAYVPTDLVYDPGTQLLALGLRTELPSGDDRLVFATRDLRTVVTSTLTNRRISTVRTGKNTEGEPRLVIAEIQDSVAIWWRPLSAMEENSAGLIAPSLRLTLLSAEPFGDGNVMGLLADETPAMTRGRYGAIGAFDSFWFFEAIADGTTIVEFLSADESSRRLFVGGRERGSGRLGRALLAEYRDAFPRALKAGARVIGQGIVTGGRRDAAGNAWLNLPWGGEIVKIDASAAP